MWDMRWEKGNLGRRIKRRRRECGKKMGEREYSHLNIFWWTVHGMLHSCSNKAFIPKNLGKDVILIGNLMCIHAYTQHTRTLIIRVYVMHAFYEGICIEVEYLDISSLAALPRTCGASLQCTTGRNLILFFPARRNWVTVFQVMQFLRLPTVPKIFVSGLMAARPGHSKWIGTNHCFFSFAILVQTELKIMPAIPCQPFGQKEVAAFEQLLS